MASRQITSSQIEELIDAHRKVLNLADETETFVNRLNTKLAETVRNAAQKARQKVVIDAGLTNPTQRDLRLAEGLASITLSELSNPDSLAGEITRLCWRIQRFQPLLNASQTIADEERETGAPYVALLEENKSSIKRFFLSRANRDRLAIAIDTLTERTNNQKYQELERKISSERRNKAPNDSELAAFVVSHDKLLRETIHAENPHVRLSPSYRIAATTAQADRILAEDAAKLLEDIESLVDKRRAAISKAVASYVASIACDQLKDIPTSELSKHKKGIRVKTLVDNGYDNLASIYAASKYSLISLNGISVSMADDIKDLTRQYVTDLKSSVHIRLSTDSKTEGATKLVRETARLLTLRDKLRKIAPEISHLHKAAQEMVKIAKELSNGTTWMSLSHDDRIATEELFDKRKAALNSPRCLKIHSLVNEILTHSLDISEQEAWELFTVQSPRFYSILEEIAPEAFANDAHYGLPEELANEIQEECFFPDGLTCELRRYQEWGVKYILHQKKVLLGDEMGLGKTVQAIATMVSLRNTGAKHFLIVCPASVLSNWVHEIRKHSKLAAYEIYGVNMLSALNDWQSRGGAAVTTYETTKRITPHSYYKCDLTIVDEAHYIKNPNAIRTKNTLKLCAYSPRLLFMTGTALENNVDEMIELIRDLQPQLISSLSMKLGPGKAAEFRDAVAPVYYRRKREDVLSELPELIEKDEWCELFPQERHEYEVNVMGRNFMASRRVSWDTPKGTPSCKLERLKEIIAESREDGRKTLVFTFFLSTAQKILNELGPDCTGFIHGGTPVKKRQSIVSDFERSTTGSVLIAQINAAGTGMNIQCASVVVICEPQCKPSIEKQAISRAYRMGQTRSVLVHHLLCTNSVDERIHEILKRKQDIFNDYADKSSAAAAAAHNNIEISSGAVGKIIEEEIERIRHENPQQAKELEREYDKKHPHHRKR